MNPAFSLVPPPEIATVFMLLTVRWSFFRETELTRDGDSFTVQDPVTALESNQLGHSTSPTPSSRQNSGQFTRSSWRISHPSRKAAPRYMLAASCFTSYLKEFRLGTCLFS